MRRVQRCFTSRATAITAPMAQSCSCSNAVRVRMSSTPTAIATSTASRACSARRSATPTARRWAPSPPAAAAVRLQHDVGRPRIRRRWNSPTASPRSLPTAIDRVFFTSGGSEAVEAAWKLARMYHVANGEPQRLKAIARNIAYHGVTLGALSFTGVPGYKEPFGPPAIYTRHVANTNGSAPTSRARRSPPSCWQRSRA